MHSISICSRTRTIQQQPALPVSSDAQHDVKAATATSASVPTHSNSQTHEAEGCVSAGNAASCLQSLVQQPC